MNKSFILKLATGLWWTIPFAFICKLAVKSSHPNLAGAIGEYIEGCLWAVGALLLIQLAVRLGLALWVTVFGPVESPNKAHRAAREQCTPGPCVESIEELAQLAANKETRKETTEETAQENAHPENTNVKITLLPDDEEDMETEPEFV